MSNIASLMQLNADSVLQRDERYAYLGRRWRHSYAIMGRDGSASIDLEPAPPETKKHETATAGHAGSFGPVGRPGRPADGGPRRQSGPRGYEVQLASYGSRDLARRGWVRLSRAAPALLGGIGYQVKRAVVDGETVYRLRTNSVTDKAEAIRLCRSLRTRDVECLVFALY